MFTASGTGVFISGGGTNNFFLFHQNPVQIAVVGVGGGNNVYDHSSATGLNDGEWHHCCFSRSGSASHFYIDDASSGTTNTNSDVAIDFTASSWAFAALNGSGSTKFAGGVARSEEHTSELQSLMRSS